MKKLPYIILAVLAVVVLALVIVVIAMPGGTSGNGEDNSTDAPSALATSTADPTGGTPAGDATSTNSSSTNAPSTNAPSTNAPADPAKPLSGLVIGIDPGHQGAGNKEKESLAPWDLETLKAKCTSGTAGKFTGVAEYIVTLQMSLKIRDTLEALGATVVMTRDTHDIDISNRERAEVGNSANADVVLRIHCNGSDNATVEGVDLYVRDKGDGTAEYKERADYDYKLATELLDFIIDETGAKKRNVNKSDAYTGINWSTVPCIIVETGFMSNEKEDNLLVTDEYQQKFADAIAKWLQNSNYLKGDN